MSNVGNAGHTPCPCTLWVRDYPEETPAPHHKACPSARREALEGVRMPGEALNLTGGAQEPPTQEAALIELIRYLADHHIGLTFPLPDETGIDPRLINPPRYVRLARVVPELNKTIYTITPVAPDLWGMDLPLALMLALRNFLGYQEQEVGKHNAGKNGSGKRIISP